MFLSTIYPVTMKLAFMQCAVMLRVGVTLKQIKNQAFAKFVSFVEFGSDAYLRK